MLRPTMLWIIPFAIASIAVSTPVNPAMACSPAAGGRHQPPRHRPHAHAASTALHPQDRRLLQSAYDEVATTGRQLVNDTRRYPFSTIGQLRVWRGDYSIVNVCTATLVDASRVLTAAHCFWGRTTDWSLAARAPYADFIPAYSYLSGTRPIDRAPLGAASTLQVGILVKATMDDFLGREPLQQLCIGLAMN